MEERTMLLKDEAIQKIQDQWARETAREERKIIRKAAIGRYYRMGWAAGFMVRRERSDIAKAIMQEAYLNLADCKEAGLSDFDLQTIRNIF
jgi:hypothetical protein